jgi:hypothetical protein
MDYPKHWIPDFEPPIDGFRTFLTQTFPEVVFEYYESYAIRHMYFDNAESMREKYFNLISAVEKSGAVPHKEGYRYDVDAKRYLRINVSTEQNGSCYQVTLFVGLEEQHDGRK